jgi:hypothetical protein
MFVFHHQEDFVLTTQGIQKRGVLKLSVYGIQNINESTEHPAPKYARLFVTNQCCSEDSVRASVLKGPEAAKQFFSSATSSRDMICQLRYACWLAVTPEPRINQSTRLCEGPLVVRCYDS